MAREHRASEFQPDFGLNWRPVLTREHVKDWDTERLAKYIALRKQVEKGAIDNPVGQGWSLPMWDKVQQNWKKYRTHCILGGNRCLRGDSLIYDPVLGISRRIDSITGPHHVLAWDGQKLVVAEAEEPFTKPAGEMLRIRLSTGAEFVAAREHRVLSDSGIWVSCSELRQGYALCLPASTLDICQQDHGRGVPRWTEKESGSPNDYLTSPRLCDEPLHEAAGNGQGVFPSQDDAPIHIFASDSNRRSPSSYALHSLEYTLGGRGNECEYNRGALWSFRPSTPDALPPPVGLSVGILSHASYRPYTEALQNNGGLAFSPVRPQSIAASSRLPQSNGGFAPPDNQSYCGVAYVESVTSAGIEVKWDMTVPAYGNYWHAGVVHHNSSKSIFAARMAVWAAATIPESQVRMYHVNSERSIQDQQQMVWDALPQSIKNLPTKKGANHSLQFSQKNGFTDSICILPPLPGYRKGGSIIFGNYRQFQQDEQVAEGFKAHAIFCDEECPQKFFETLLFRTIDYDGKIFLTFTTLQGWTPLIQDILGKTKTLESATAPLLGNRQVPLIQESLSRKETCIYYFHTAANPFIDSEAFLKTLSSRPKDEILARAYGIPTKSIAGVFPGFSREYAPAGNVIKHEDLPWLKERPKDKRGKEIPYKVTRYMAIDPAGSKNWFCTWVAIDASGTWFVYREWPDYDDWALPGNTPEGKPGPAQKGSKKGIKEYVELIKGMEGDEEIFERYIDPRMGAAEKQSDEGATTIISDLSDADMPVIPAPGVDIENGIQLINNLLAWDENKPRDSMNAPKFYVSDRCQNIIACMQSYSGMGGRSENFKDPPDTLRYLAVSDIQFIDQAKITDQQAYGRTGSY